MGNLISQSFPPYPGYKAEDVPSLTGRTYIVTGANTGLGREVANILYGKNAVVWIACRDERKATLAMDEMRNAYPKSSGKLFFLHIDLADLPTIPVAVASFLQKETCLHGLFNNAGVMLPPDGSITVQGFELQLGVNCLGHFLLTNLLAPVMIATARTAPDCSVRVVWVSSSAADAMSPTNGVEIDNLHYQADKSMYHKYGVSKAGLYYYSTEFAKRYRSHGVLSVALNPGNLLTELDRTSPWWVVWARRLVCYPAVYGAYTEIFAAFSPLITMENTGAWVVPWGRFLPIRDDLQKGSLSEEEGGSNVAARFWEWSDDQVAKHLKPGV